MRSLERITDWIALAWSSRGSSLFSTHPTSARERLRIPRPLLGGWHRYPGFAESSAPRIDRSRRPTVSGWRTLVLLCASLASLSAAADARAAKADWASRETNNIEDARRQTQIATVYATNALLRDDVLIVTVTGANVTLVGKAGSTVEKDLAEQIALSVDGIEHVDNLIGTTDMPNQRSRGNPSFGEKVDDATTTAAIRSKLLWGKTTSGLEIRVLTVRGKVRLDGTVYDSAQSDLIAQVAADTAGALSVTNAIVVFSVPPVTSGAQADAQKLVDDRLRPVSDPWITARIESTFLLSPSVNRSAISVATNEGIVSLSGVAGSASARTSAIVLATNTHGVRSVESARLVAN